MDHVEQTKRLLKRSQAIIETARSNVQRARAATIQATHLADTARATRYANHLIRGIRR